LDDGAVEDAAGRSDERMALLVLLVARLLADHHDVCPPRPFARHHLGGVAIERAARAAGLRIAQGRQALDIGQVIHDHAMNSAARWFRAGHRRREGTMGIRRCARALLGMLTGLAIGWAAPVQAQSDLAKAFAPTGTLRVGVLMVTYFALPD